MNEKRNGGRARRWVAALSLAGLGVTGAAGVGAYEVVQASKSSTSVADSASSGGLSAGSGSSMTRSGGS
jgi:hypothetical protein